MLTRSRERQGFTLVELLVVIAIIGILIALLLPAVQAAREAARRTQCTNNLKQMGLGIQNYEDIRKETCPAYLSTAGGATPTGQPTNHVTWAVLLLPFMEQQNLYETWVIQTVCTTAQPTTNNLKPYQVAVNTYFCPSKRTPPQFVTTAGGGGAPVGAAVGDYACVAYGAASNTSATVPVSGAAPLTYDGAMTVSRAFNIAATPTIIAGVELGVGDYRSLTNFASVIDGLSNTAFIGEKALHKISGGNATANHVDGCIYSSGTTAGQALTQISAPTATALGRYRMATPANTISMAFFSRGMVEGNGNYVIAPLNPVVANSPTVLPRRPTQEDPQNRFGSWHPGVTLFLKGDGSASSVSNAASTSVMMKFGSRNDRKTFDLP